MQINFSIDEVVNSDKFLSMKGSSVVFYFWILENCDSEGVVDDLNICKKINNNEEGLNELLKNSYIIYSENGSFHLPNFWLHKNYAIANGKCHYCKK